MRLDAEIVHAFTGSLLQERFEAPKPTPDFHKELWEECCVDQRFVAIACPRGHAKTTAVTHSFSIASLLFRDRRYLIIISDTEEQAAEFLGDIKLEFKENEKLIEAFGVKKIEVDTQTDFIVRFNDGHSFRIRAKGAEQKVRGRKWRGTRPDMIILDDLENEELVANKERRAKLKKWFYGSVIPALSDRGIIRYVGTILHLDSLLEGLMPPSSGPGADETDRNELKEWNYSQARMWRSVRWKAHNDDFSQILWESKFPKERLLEIQQEFRRQGLVEEYYQEYLNTPIALEDQIFRKEDMLAMTEEDMNKPMIFYAAADFAISEKEKADETVIIVGGMDEDGYLNIVDLRKGRWDSLRIVDEMLSVQKRYDVQLFCVETEKIDKAIGPFLDIAMMKHNLFINIEKKVPTKDKIMRATSIAARTKQGGVRFNKEASWYPALEAELLQVTRSGVKGKHDDQLDAFAWLGLAINEFHNSPTRDEIEENDWDDEYDMYFGNEGACSITGY